MDKCDTCKNLSETETMRHDESGSYCEACYRKAFVQGAIDAGIPMSVIEGKTKLSDHFSNEYIEFKSNRGMGRL